MSNQQEEEVILRDNSNQIADNFEEKEEKVVEMDVKSGGIAER